MWEEYKYKQWKSCAEPIVISSTSISLHICTTRYQKDKEIHMCERIRCFWASAVRGAEIMAKSKTIMETCDHLSFFNIIFSSLVAPEDQVMRTWGSSFSRTTGVQYAKLVSNWNNLQKQKKIKETNQMQMLWSVFCCYLNFSSTLANIEKQIETLTTERGSEGELFFNLITFSLLLLELVSVVF